MSDTIYRQAAIDAFCKECYDTDGEICNRDDVCGNVMILKALPSARSEPHWIPCSERLPEAGAVLITDGNEILIGEYYGDSTWSVDGCDYNPDLEEIAWMPLPEPYKGGNRNEAD